MPTRLDQVYENKRATVIDIQGGQGIRQRLGQMGIHPGDTITMLRYGVLRGPILIEVHGSQVPCSRVKIGSGTAIEENVVIHTPLSESVMLGRGSP
ncbi:MAG: hypothetical protein A2156_03195 [Deltaproteobacteria bacterium RBG_16_48_10]|nr:MAG: hypothetical protein A2156_03195 [Deltaproteobacteria bacterium RBG_16_48_10]